MNTVSWLLSLWLKATDNVYLGLLGKGFVNFPVTQRCHREASDWDVDALQTPFYIWFFIERYCFLFKSHWHFFSKRMVEMLEIIDGCFTLSWKYLPYCSAYIHGDLGYQKMYDSISCTPEALIQRARLREAGWILTEIIRSLWIW